MNDFRSGEKVVLNGADMRDFTVAVYISFIEGERDAGILFRSVAPRWAMMLIGVILLVLFLAPSSSCWGEPTDNSGKR